MYAGNDVPRGLAMPLELTMTNWTCHDINDKVPGKDEEYDSFCEIWNTTSIVHTSCTQQNCFGYRTHKYYNGPSKPPYLRVLYSIWNALHISINVCMPAADKTAALRPYGDRTTSLI